MVAPRREGASSRFSSPIWDRLGSPVNQKHYSSSGGHTLIVERGVSHHRGIMLTQTAKDPLSARKQGEWDPPRWDDGECSASSLGMTLNSPRITARTMVGRPQHQDVTCKREHLTMKNNEWFSRPDVDCRARCALYRSAFDNCGPVRNNTALHGRLRPIYLIDSLTAGRFQQRL